MMMIMMRLKNLVSAASKLQLFKAAMLPYLSCCHLTWHFCRVSDERKLKRIQEGGLHAVNPCMKSS